MIDIMLEQIGNIKMDNTDDLLNKLNKISSNSEKISCQIDLEKLFTIEFMQKNTKFSTFQEMLNKGTEEYAMSILLKGVI